MQSLQITRASLIQTLSAPPYSVDGFPIEYVVIDTETMGHNQCEFFTWLAQYLPKGQPRTPQMLLTACEPDIIDSARTLRNGAIRKTTSKRPKPFAQSVVDHCNDICRGLGKKGGLKPGKQLFENTWKLFDREALHPHESKVYNVQVGLYANDTVYWFCESSREPEQDFTPVVKAVYDSGLPLLGQNIDFDFRQIGSTLGLWPKIDTVVFDTKLIESLFVGDKDRDRKVGLSDLNEYYDVPVAYRKTGIQPQFVDWRDPGPDQLSYAVNDILSCAYIFNSQRCHASFEAMRPTILLESSVRVPLAYVSIKGVPIHNTVARFTFGQAVASSTRQLEVVLALGLRLGFAIPPESGLKFVGSKEFRELVVNGLRPFARKDRPLDGVGKKDVYKNLDYPDFPQEWKDFLEAFFLLNRYKKQVNGLAKILKKTQLEGITWLHPEYGTVPPPMAEKKTGRNRYAENDSGGTRSGRMSTRGELSPLTMSEVDKQIVVAPEGQVIFSCDLSGIELRVAASLSHDQNLIDIVNSGTDIYRVVASKAFDIPYEEIGKKSAERNLGKEAVLAFIFEASPYTLQAQIRNRTAGRLQLSDADARKLYDVWWELAPTLKTWSRDNWVQGCVDGFYQTAKHRRRYFNLEDYREELAKKEKWGKSLWKPDILRTSTGEAFAHGEALFRASCPSFRRLCSNHKVQTTAGEGFKLGISRMPIRERGWGVVGFVHDANDLLIPETDLPWAVDFIPYTMLQSTHEVLIEAGGAPIALGVEGTIGKCWAKYFTDRATEYVVPGDTPDWYQKDLAKWSLSNGNFTRE